MRQRLYDRLLSRHRTDEDPAAAAIDTSDFELRDDRSPSAWTWSRSAADPADGPDQGAGRASSPPPCSPGPRWSPPACCCSTGSARLTFWRDEWDFLLHRRSWSVGTFLDPFVEHLVAASILIYKVGVSAFGMDSARPFQVVAVAAVPAQRRPALRLRAAGGWANGSPWPRSCPILFLGPSWDDLLFPFQMALFGSVACGIGALLAIERRDRTGDLVAMGLLLLGLLFSDLGIPFVAGATVQLAFDRDRWRRAWSSSFPPSSGCSGTPGGAMRRTPSSP